MDVQDSASEVPNPQASPKSSKSRRTVVISAPSPEDSGDESPKHVTNEKARLTLRKGTVSAFVLCNDDQGGSGAGVSWGTSLVAKPVSKSGEKPQGPSRRLKRTGTVDWDVIDSMKRKAKTLENESQQRLVARHMRELLAQIGDGSVLRGWRFELDPEGKGEVAFVDLCTTATRIGFTDDVAELCGIDGDIKTLTIDELGSDLGALLGRFKMFVKAEFGTPAAFFQEIAAGTETVGMKEFAMAVNGRGFGASSAEMGELFGACDPGNHMSLTSDDLVFLETNPALRDLEMFKIKTRYKDQHRRYLHSVYDLERSIPVPAHHRLAPRAWNAPKFECLPTVLTLRRSEWSRNSRRKSERALEIFRKELRDQYGSEIRAWRRGLDPNTTLKITMPQLRKYCRKMHSAADVPAIWRHLDIDADGFIGIEELCPKPSLHLCCFRLWALASFETCAAIWDCPEMREMRCSHKGSWASDKKMLLAPFGNALRALGWPSATDADARRSVLMSLDGHGCGFVSVPDLEWLDRLEFPEWMGASSNEDAWWEYKGLLVKAFRHPLAAWRKLLDTDDSNMISWAEFKAGGEHVHFHGDVAGAWRFLDDDLSGFISMAEYDKHSAELLGSFKQFLDKNFGSVAVAFKALDRNGNGLVSLPELRRICQDLRWQGDVREIFNCLDKDEAKDAFGDNCGKRSLSVQELSFLDTWKVEVGSRDSSDEETGETFGPTIRRSTLRKSKSKSFSAPKVSMTPRAALFFGDQSNARMSTVQHSESRSERRESKLHTPPPLATRRGSSDLPAAPGDAETSTTSAALPVAPRKGKRMQSCPVNALSSAVLAQHKKKDTLASSGPVMAFLEKHQLSAVEESTPEASPTMASKPQSAGAAWAVQSHSEALHIAKRETMSQQKLSRSSIHTVSPRPGGRPIPRSGGSLPDVELLRPTSRGGFGSLSNLSAVFQNIPGKVHG